MILKLKMPLLPIRRYVLAIFFIFTFTGIPSDGVAVRGESEIFLHMQSLGNLPDYCKYKIAETKFKPLYKDSNNTKEVNWPPKFGSSLNQWQNRLGLLNWTYIHHYCFGIRAMNTYNSMDSKERKEKGEQQLNVALREFEFVRASRARDVFPFYYNLYRYEYIIYSGLGNYQKSKWAIEQSLKYRSK